MLTVTFNQYGIILIGFGFLFYYFHWSSSLSLLYLLRYQYRPDALSLNIHLVEVIVVVYDVMSICCHCNCRNELRDCVILLEVQAIGFKKCVLFKSAFHKLQADFSHTNEWINETLLTSFISLNNSNSNFHRRVINIAVVASTEWTARPLKPMSLSVESTLPLSSCYGS